MSVLSRVLVAVLLLLVGLGFLRSRSLAWGGADAPDGTRFKVSPVGLSHVLSPKEAVSPTRNCHWDQTPSELCAAAPGQTAAFRRLMLVPLVVLLAALLAGGAGLGLLSTGAAGKRVRLAMLLTATVLAVGAPLVFARSAPRALVALQGLEFGVGGTLGTLQIAVGSAVLAGLGVAQMLTRSGGGPFPWLLSVALLLLPLAAFVTMFPLLGGLLFLGTGAGLGFVAGRWAEPRMQPSGWSPTQ